jgi:hypothetical protein
VQDGIAACALALVPDSGSMPALALVRVAFQPVPAQVIAGGL